MRSAMARPGRRIGSRAEIQIEAVGVQLEDRFSIREKSPGNPLIQRLLFRTLAQDVLQSSGVGPQSIESNHARFTQSATGTAGK